MAGAKFEDASFHEPQPLLLGSRCLDASAESRGEEVFAAAAATAAAHDDVAKAAGSGAPAGVVAAEEVRELEARLASVRQAAREARGELAEASALRRALAWQVENLELRLHDDQSGRMAVATQLQSAKRGVRELNANYGAEIADLRQRLVYTVQVNQDLRARCAEIEREVKKT
eukprot:TRINITY_DN24559_c0_g1_i1.p1 TRINITY_DN24559_c0_g1~~TRINITY_DN24559_c0_g1_i1.p1  ORF type:complete len:173 (+),score=49.58 TRINITY_DN24559_c0_g1_i1:65-583(+)